MSQVLAAQQAALLDLLHVDTIDLIALTADPKTTNGPFCLKNKASAVRGLRAYRANAQALCERALHTCYPVLQQLLGGDNFAHLAQDFWHAAPPQRGDLAQWGSELADYLRQVPQLQTLLEEHAYLPDVAKVEWALHCAATASDAALDAQSFELFAATDSTELRLRLSPGCAVLPSAYPVVAIAHLHDARMSTLHEAARYAIAAGQGQSALIWRQGFRPMLSAVDVAPRALIEAVLQGRSLAGALDAALVQTPDFDVSAWLAASVQSGLVVGVSVDVASGEAASNGNSR